MMKHTTISWLLAALIGSASGLALAHEPPTSGMPGQQMHGHMPERMQERMGRAHARFQEQLKQKLKLNADQQDAWSRYVQAAVMPPRAMPPKPAEFENLTTPERIDKLRAWRTEQQARRNQLMDQRMDATKAFYAALQPEQQKVFDSETLRHHSRMQPMHERHKAGHPQGGAAPN